MSLLKRFYVLALASGAMVISSCGTSAHIEKDPASSFSNYKTYTWVDKENKDRLKNGIAEQNLKTIVNSELQKNGFREVKNNPDMLLTYDLLVEKSVKEQSEPVYSRPFSRLYFNPYTRRY